MKEKPTYATIFATTKKRGTKMGGILLCWFVTLASVALSFALPFSPWMLFIYIGAVFMAMLSIVATVSSMEELKHEKK